MLPPSNVHPFVEPDPAMMLKHLEHLFDGFLDGCHDGLIEIAWADAGDGKLKHAQLFGTDKLEEAVELAARTNRVPNQNVYVGAALRKLGTPPFGRASDTDFLALTSYYVDLDAEGAATAVKQRYRGAAPTAAVITGRRPFMRVQLWWRQELPDRDPESCRRQNAALAAGLAGDPTVVNPSRVMRLAGSVAWPAKPGRVIERTELQLFDDGRPKAYMPGLLARLFPPIAPDSTSAPARGAGDQMARESTRLNIGSQGITVENCLAAVRRGDHWHDNIVRLVGHWIARGWSDAEVLAMAEGLTLTGYTVDQTRRDLARMIEGGRRKWNVPSPDHNLEPENAEPLSPLFVADLAVAMIPRRRWLLGRSLLRRHVSVRVSPGGTGKSTLGIEEAVSIVTGRPLVGQTVHEQTKAWIYNNEDDSDELRRRLAAVLQHWSIPLAEVKGRLAINSGAGRQFNAARLSIAGAVIRLPDVDACIEHIRTHGIGLFIADPFIETHAVDENSNEQIKAVMTMFRDIARQGDCAVMLVHHTAKPPQGASDGHAGNMNAARGASAITSAARVVQTLFGMSKRDAEGLGIAERERHLYVRLDDAKANLGLISSEASWFRRVSVTIANGDEVGVLVPADLTAPHDADDPALDQPVLDAIAKAWREGTPLTDQPRARTRFAPAILASELGVAADSVATVIARLMARGVIRMQMFDRKRHLTGLNVVPLDERAARDGSMDMHAQ